MKFKQKLILGLSCVRTCLLGQKKPIIVSWAITDRCNLECKYCGVWKRHLPDLETFRVLRVIKDLSMNGTRILRFTGGEPLLREDIAEVINYACDQGIAVNVSTNGILFPSIAEKIKRISGVNISLEGPEEIHDSIRGYGSFSKAWAAIKTAWNLDIPIVISATLNSLNMGDFGYLLKIAQEYNSKVFFQPATKMVLYGNKLNDISPNPDEYKSVISSLIKIKKTDKSVGNSVAGLRYMLHWPDKAHINCVAGRIICKLDPQSNVRPCARFSAQDEKLNIAEKGVKYCFARLPSPTCGNCWCSSMVELNLAMAFNPGAIINLS